MHRQHTPVGDRFTADEMPAAVRGGLDRRIGSWLAAERPFDPRFEPSHSALQAGVIRGGGTVNIIPGCAVIEIGLRSVPRQTRR